MPVSNKHKFIFVHIPKCAGSSIEQALMKTSKLTLMRKAHLSDEEIREKQLTVAGYFHRIEKHLSAKDIKKLLGDEHFYNYFKFAFVRNPFDRLPSYYLYIKRKVNPNNNKHKLLVKLAHNSDTFKEFIIEAIKYPEMELLFNQYIYIYDENDNNLMDFIGKFENLSSHWNFIVNHIIQNNRLKLLPMTLGLYRPKLPYANQSKSVNYRDYYDDELRELVEKACQKDLELFGYKF